MDTKAAERVAQKCITSIARQYLARLPVNTKYDYDDLKQEGWIVYWRLASSKRTRLNNEAEFAAYLRHSLKWRYNKIVREESWPSRLNIEFHSNLEHDEQALATTAHNPERLLQLKQAIGAIREANNDVGYYLIFGLHPEEFGFLRYLQRQRRQKRWTMNGMRYRWTPESVKLFFGFDATSFPLCGYI